MDILFESICNRLANQVPELRWIDWEQGQLEIPAEKLPLFFPAVLIDIQDIQWSNVGDQMQVGDVTIQVRLCFDIYEDLYTVDGEPNPTRETALERLKLVNKVYKALQGFEGGIIQDLTEHGPMHTIPPPPPVFLDNHFNKLNRIRTNSERRDDGYKVITTTFACNMRDQNAMPVDGYATVTLQVNPDPEYIIPGD